MAVCFIYKGSLLFDLMTTKIKRKKGRMNIREKEKEKEMKKDRNEDRQAK